MNTETKTDPPSTFESQPPWNIDPRKAQDEETHKKFQETIDAWIEAMQKDIHELLKKNGIEKFQIVFHHPGTKELVILNKGSLLENTVLAKEAYVVMKSQVNKLVDTNI